MQLTDDEVREFMAICKRAFNRDLSFEEARFVAMRYLHLLEMLARPLPRGPDAPLAENDGPRYGDSERPPHSPLPPQ